MKWFGLSIAMLLVALLVAGLWKSGAKVTPAPPERPQAASRPEGYVGAASCRECHTRFHELWATSYHGLAMQPFTAELARTKLVPQKDEIEIGKRRYVAVFEDGKGCVRERGPDGEKTYPIAHVMGGKNVYYFLTPAERGRLQTLPVAYDVRRKEWFNTTGSGVRHFPGLPDDEAVDWKNRAYTFNTSCFGCHVSQLSTNYDLKTDTYHTVWAEPGINCESCHGGAEEHIRVCREAAELHPQDPKYAYTLAFFQRKKGDRQDAIRTLRQMVDKQMPCADAYVMLGEILEQHQEIDQAIAVYRKAMENENLSKPQRHGFATRIRTLLSRRARNGQKNQQ